MRNRLAVLVLAGGLVAVLTGLAGCSGDAGNAPAASTTTSTPDSAAIRAGLVSLYAGDHPTASSTTDGGCVADALLAGTTPDELRDAGVLDAAYLPVRALPKLPAPLAERWVDAQLGCTDYVESSAHAHAALSHGSLDAEEYAACLRGAVTGPQLREALVATLTGDWDGSAVSRLSDAESSCAGH